MLDTGFREIGMLMRCALIAALFFSAGCATHNTSCPAVKEYSAKFQDDLAVELDSLPEGAVIPEAIADYYVLREQSRACR